MKQLIKEFIPPVFFRLTKKKTPPPEKKIIYNAYADALSQCTTDAYEENELVEIIVKKTQRFAKEIATGGVNIWETAAYSMLGIINPIIENHPGPVNVLDFGGAAGAHYFITRQLINKNVQLNWVVVETPGMVKQATQLATPELSFVDNFEEAVYRLGKIHLLHSSGTLQCVDNPLYFLNQIVNCNATWLLLNRLGLNKKDNDVITIHSSMLSWNGIGPLPEGYTDRWVKYPFTFLAENKFLETLQNNYSIAATFNDRSGMYPVEGEAIIGYGILCKKN